MRSRHPPGNQPRAISSSLPSWPASVLATSIAAAAIGAASAIDGKAASSGRLKLVQPVRKVVLDQSLAGLGCEVEHFSNLRYGERSTVQFSFTPLYSPKRIDHLLVCFNTQRMALKAPNVTVLLVQEYNPHTDTTRVVAQTPTVTTSTIPDMLANDPYFASSFADARYDDFVGLDPTLSDLVQWSTVPGEQDNCMVLSASWQFNQIYTVGLQYSNPPAAGSPVGGGERLDLWIAPLGLEEQPGSEASAATAPQVRGPKYGVKCSAGGLPRWSPGSLSVEALTATVAPRADTRLRNTTCASSNATSCATCLYALGTPSTIGSACGPTAFLCCSSCDAAGVAIVGAGAGIEWCPDSRNVTGGFESLQTATVDSVERMGLRTTAGLAGLAESVCNKYSALKAQMLSGGFSDQVVPGTVFAAFLEEAAPLVDLALVRSVNQTVWDLLTDGRRPAWPTRLHGVGRRCSSGWGGCTADGFFEDVRVSQQLDEHSATWIGQAGTRSVPVYADRRYRSLYTFGLMGAALRASAAAYECDGLMEGTGGALGKESGEPWPLALNEL